MAPRTDRKLAAILAADVVGYSRLVGDDEAGTIARLKALRKEFIEPLIAQYHGRVVKLMGDGALVEFASAVDAVECAVAIQRGVAKRQAELPGDQRIAFRIGINIGDVIIEEGDIYGHGVNVAARLEALCEPGGIALSGNVHEQVQGKLNQDFADAGAHEVKNIAHTIRVWHWSGAANGESTVTRSKPLTLPDKPSIAVLPFDNMSSGDLEQEYFSDGVTEEIITTLSKVPRLFVISRNSTVAYKGRPVDVKQVAVEQGVRYILQGSVRKAGNQVRITAQLIDAANTMHLWADHFDGSLDDVFSLQDKIAQEIVGALEITLTEGVQARLWRRRAGDPRVYEHFLRGRDLYFRFTRRSNAQAREEFNGAIQFNPDFPMTYVFLSYTYEDEVRWGWSSNPEQSLRAAHEMAQRALELDPDLPDGLAAMAYFHLLRREHDEAVALAERAAALGPSNTDVHHVAAEMCNYAGLAEQGLSFAKHAVRLSPMSYSNSLTELGHSYCLLGRYDEAIAILRQVLTEVPYWRSAHALLVLTLHESGRVEEARSQANAILRAAPRFSLNRWAESHPYRRKEDLERYIGALRSSGLPE
jgi:TolB-like protein/class 3 adenylate cyclase/tetratricopeptide (TPR) repeat protein